MLHLCFLFCVRFQWLLYLVLWFCFSILFFYPTSETESVLISMLICVCNNVSFCARCRDTVRRKIEWWIFLSVSSTGMKVTKISESKKYSRNFLENITIYMENWNLRNGKVQSLIDNSDKFPSISDMINWEILGSFLYHSNLVYFKLHEKIFKVSLLFIIMAQWILKRFLFTITQLLNLDRNGPARSPMILTQCRLRSIK